MSTADEGPLPQVEHLPGHRVVKASPVGEGKRLLEVLGLDLQRRELTAVHQAHQPTAGRVVADLADRPDRVLERQVAQHDAVLDHPEHEVGRTHLEQRRRLGQVGVADDDMQAAVLLGVRVRLVPGVDDGTRAGRRRGDAFPDVLSALAETEDRTAWSLQHLAGTGDQLPRDEEGDEDVGRPCRTRPAGRSGSSRGSRRSCRPSRCCS